MTEMTIANSATDNERWASLIERNPDRVAPFFTGVRTTGIYCRPTCTARRPLRQNVVFFESAAEAERAGFRPCKRCQPQLAAPRDRGRDAVIAACRLLDATTETISLDQLAGAVGVSSSHLLRLFKREMGMTPKHYADARRMRQVQNELPGGSSVTRVLYDAGYGSSSRFYDGATRRLGMTPATYQNGAPGETIQYAVERSSLGWLLVAATNRGVCAIELGDDRDALATRLLERFPRATLSADDAEFAAWVRQVSTLVEAPTSALHLPLDVRGTAFQHRVWTALQEIPAGQTESYGSVARRIGHPGAARGVAQACASNPVAVAIPCHRVIGQDGRPRGYRWGIERKLSLLERERDTPAA